MPVLSTDRPRSLVHGTDQDCLRKLIPLHVVPDPVVLDSTWGRGRMWKGLDVRPTERMDCRPDMPDLTYVGDFRKMPEEWTDRFDLVVFDPPHMAEAGRNSAHADRFGSLVAGMGHVPDITHLYAPFLLEARRVLRPNGVILAKLIDTVHRGHFRFQATDFVIAVRAMRGLTACDYIVKDEERASTMTGHNWQIAHHTRRAHCFWFVVRKGRCYRPTTRPE